MSRPELPAQWSKGDTILDLYEVTGILGEGGMGRVYKVFHKRWKIDLAVKSPKPDILEQASGKDNFIREAETWVNLGLHPHTVSCYYVRTIDEIPRVFVECVEGGSLADWIRKRKLYEGGYEKTIERILDVAIQFAWGLDYAHQQGLVHQDVKPANVLMTPDGIAKVTDFGLAQARANSGEVSIPSAPGERIIVAGTGLMTPAYCSPEQASGRSLTRKTDIWSWGLSVLEMFAGAMFWAAGTPVGVAVGQLAPQALTSYLEDYMQDQSCIDMPVPVATLLERCFAADPSERPRDMQEIADALISIYGQVTGSPYARRTPQQGKGIADSLNNRAMSLIDLGKQSKAEEQWEEALRIQPQHPESLFNRGLVRWRSGRITDVDLLNDLNEAYRSNRHEWAKFDRCLSDLHLERDDYEALLEMTEGVLLANPDSADCQHAVELCQQQLPKSRRLVRSFKGHTDSINSICLTPDGRYIVVACTNNHQMRQDLDRAFNADAPEREKGTFKLLDFETGELVHNFGGYDESISSICITSDGRYVFSGADGALKVWDIELACCAFEFAGNTYTENSIAHTPDKRYEIRGVGYEAIGLWPTEPEEWYCPFNGYTGQVGSVYIGYQGQMGLRVVSRDKNGLVTLMLFEVATGRDLRPFIGTFTGEVGEIRSIRLSNDERFLLASGGADPLRMWEIETGECTTVSDGYDRYERSACLSPDAKVVLSANGTTLKLWDTDAKQCIRVFEGHTAQVNSVCMTKDGRFALSCSGDGSGNDNTIRLWELETGRCLRIFEGHKSWVKAICLLPDERHLLSAGMDHTMRLWDIATGQCSRTFSGHEGGVVAVCVTPDGRFALSGGMDDTVRVWSIERTSNTEMASMLLSKVQTSDEFFKYETTFMQELDLARQARARGESAVAASHLRTARSQPGYDRHTDAVNLWLDLYSDLPRIAFKRWWDENPFGDDNEIAIACFTPDGKHMLSGTRETYDEASGNFGRFLKLWEVETGRCVQSFYAHKEEIKGISISNDGRLALTGSSAPDETLKLWEIATGNLVTDFGAHKGSVHAACLSPNGRYAVTATGGEYFRDSHDNVELKIWNTVTGLCLRTLRGHTDMPLSVAISPDNYYALTGSRDQTLRLWDINTGQCLQEYKGHTYSVLAVCVSQDGKHAVSGSSDNTARFWDIETGQCIRTFEGHVDTINSVALSSNGRFALTGSSDQTARLWDVSTGVCLQGLDMSNYDARCVSFSPDERFALVVGKSKLPLGPETIRFLFIDWELGDNANASIVSK